MGCSLAIKRVGALTGERNPAEMQEVFVAVRLIYRAIHAKNSCVHPRNPGLDAPHLNLHNPVFQIQR
jgi:hypothetical protein